MLVQLGFFIILLSGLSAARLIIARYLSLTLYSIIFLPGVITHELSHFFIATILGVPTGKIEIFPRPHSRALGSIQVASTDFVRASLIGIAPFLIGSFTIVALNLWLHLPYYLDFYLIFALANTMFTSQSDLRSWPAFLVILLMFLLVALWSGLAVSLVRPLETILAVLNASYFLALKLDLILLLPLLVLKYRP